MKVYDFHTAPEKGEDYRFAQLSDLQGLGNCNETVYKIGCTHSGFILYSGGATYISWRIQWFDVGEFWQDEETKKESVFPMYATGRRCKAYAIRATFLLPGKSRA